MFHLAMLRPPLWEDVLCNEPVTFRFTKLFEKVVREIYHICMRLRFGLEEVRRQVVQHSHQLTTLLSFQVDVWHLNWLSTNFTLIALFLRTNDEAQEIRLFSYACVTPIQLVTSFYCTITIVAWYKDIKLSFTFNEIFLVWFTWYCVTRRY